MVWPVFGSSKVRALELANGGLRVRPSSRNFALCLSRPQVAMMQAANLRHRDHSPLGWCRANANTLTYKGRVTCFVGGPNLRVFYARFDWTTPKL